MAKKTGIRQRGSSWEAWVYDKRAGKKIRKTFPTQAAAKSWRADATSALGKGELRAPTAETVRAAGEALIAGMEDGSVLNRSGRRYKPSVIRSYRASLERHVYLELGARKLANVQYPDLQDLVDRLAAKGLDGSTIRNTVNPLRVIYDRARYTIPVNPTTRLRFPARGDKPRRVVTAEQVATRLAVLAPDDRAIRATAFYAGLRSGELQALDVDDVELYPEGRWGLIHVRRSWDKAEGFVATKSAAGVRAVPVCEQVYELLEPHLRDRAGLAFGQSVTEPFSYNAVRERTERVWRRAGLEPSDLGLHEARHTFSSLLAAAGVPKDRRDRYLGHSDPTMDGRYTHQLDPSYLDDAQALSAYLRRADTPSRIAGAPAGVREEAFSTRRA